MTTEIDYERGRLERHSSTGWFGCCFGFPFWLGGIGALLAGIAAGINEGEIVPALFATPLGLIFLAVGLGFSFGRSNLCIDRTSGILSHRWFLWFIPVHTRTTQLSEFDRVQITRETRRTKNSTYTVYVVYLNGQSEEHLEEHREFFPARQCAEEMAKVLQFPIHDKSSGQTVIREVETLDESLADQFARSGEIEDIPPKPESSRIIETIDGQTATFRIPALGWNGMPTVMFAIAAVIDAIVFGVLALVFVLSDSMDDALGFAFVGIVFGGFSSFALIYGALKMATLDQEIRVSPGGLYYRTTSSFDTSEVTLPANEIEEVEVLRPTGGSGMSGRVLAIRSDRANIEIGHGIAADELVWLCAVIRLALITANS